MRLRSARVWTFLLLLSLLLAGRTSVSAQADPLVWSQVAGIPSDVIFQAVVMYDEYTAFAVGSTGTEGVIYKFQYPTGRWTATEEQRFSAPLNALAVIAPDNIWVVGDDGLLAHKTAAGWSVGAAPVASTSLRSIQMFGAGSEGWAAGYTAPAPESGALSTAVLLHYSDGAWHHDASVSGDLRIEGLHFASGGGWLAGNNGIWRSTNGAWQDETLPHPCDDVICYSSFTGVRAIDADEAWAVGSSGSICAACSKNVYYIAHRINGQWQRVARGDGVIDGPRRTTFPIESPLNAVTFADASHGLAVGSISEIGVATRLMIFRYTSGEWRNEPLPLIVGALNGVTMLDARHALAVGSNGIAMSYGYGQQPQAQPYPTARVSNPNRPDTLYFEVVGHSLSGIFKNYWENNGGLPVFGYPLTEAFPERSADTGAVYTVQYLERQRYELHYENYGTPYEVLLGRLGVEALTLQGRDWRTFPKASSSQAHYYPETGHAIAPEFWDYWRSHGLEFGEPGVSFAESLALFGYPISEPQLETNSSGDTVLTQWFERARFEYHPNNPAEYRVLLGRLAADLVAARGW
jgi:hypothetical protein